MEIRSKLGVEAKAHNRMVKSLGVVLKRVTEMRLSNLKESISLNMFTSNCLPYEASKTYRTIMTEANCRRAQTLVDAQRYLTRGQ
jgi:hypothetical protein